MDTEKEPITRREFDLVTSAHAREHVLHQSAHEVEHEMTQAALVKSDLDLERRLEGMNEFRAQLEKQAGAFLTREIFDAYVKDQAAKVELALNNNTEKYDAVINAMINRHDSDTDALKDQIQSEREYRKTFEGSVNTWKWIATFLGASGLGGVILLFITRFTS